MELQLILFKDFTFSISFLPSAILDYGIPNRLFFSSVMICMYIYLSTSPLHYLFFNLLISLHDFKAITKLMCMHVTVCVCLCVFKNIYAYIIYRI